MQQRDAVVFFHRLLVAAQFPCQHGGILRHAGGMTVGIAVLHIDDLCERLGDAADEGHGFLVLLFQLLRLPADIKPNDHDQQQQRGQSSDDIEPDFLIKSLFLCDLNGNDLVAAAHIVPELHHIMVSAAAQVGIIHWHHVAAVDRHAASLKSLQLKAHLRIVQRIIEHKAGNGQLLGAVRDGKRACFVRVDEPSVRFHEGDHGFQIVDILKGLVDIDLADTGAARDIQVAVRGQLAVGIGRGDAGQSVGQAVMDGIDLPVGKQFLGRRHIDAVA